MTRCLFAVACLLTLWACHSGADAASARIDSYQVVKTYPHDPEAFTQGLEFRNGYLYESTGQNGKSTIRKVELESGAVLQQTALPERYFGEGITISRGRVIGLTWTSGTGFIYGLEGFHVLGTFNYPGEGWGLTHDDHAIYMSDGSTALRVWDPETLAEKRRIEVRDGETPVPYLNELEWVKGEIWANVWQTERIARISPSSGRVTGWIDLTGLLTDAERARTDVLNGIAYDAGKDRLFVTGKLWPKLFEIRVVKK